MVSIPKPLIPGTHLYRLPAQMSELPSNSADLLELSLVADDYTYHWHKAGYDPFDATKPHFKQQEFHKNLSKFRAFMGGRGAGKTNAGAAELVQWLIRQPGLVAIVSAPTFPILNESTVPKLEQVLHPWAIAYENKVEGIKELVNGSKIVLRSTEKPKSIRGITAGYIWYDEGAHGSADGWRILIGCLRQPHYRRLGVVTTTPLGMDWTFDYFGDPARGERLQRDYWFIDASSRDNPWLPEDFIETLETSYTGSFAKQEIEGKWTTFAGLVYDNFSREVHVRPLKEMIASGELVFREVWYGHDWGYKDPMVVLAVGLDEDRRMYVIDEWYESKKLMGDVIKTRERFEKAWGEGQAVADARRPEFIRELNMAGFVTMPDANKDIMEGVTKFRSRLTVQGDARPRIYIDQSCVKTIREFYRYRFPEEDDQKAIKDKPIDRDNHSMDVLRYLGWELDSDEGLAAMANKELDEVFG